MSDTLLTKAKDLLHQAETEKSHHYTATILRALIAEIAELTADRDSWAKQTVDRVNDVLAQAERAEKAEAENATLRAELASTRSAEYRWLRERYSASSSVYWVIESVAQSPAEYLLLDPPQHIATKVSDPFNATRFYKRWQAQRAISDYLSGITFMEYWHPVEHMDCVGPPAEQI